jgi:hypothetical protein
MLTVVQGGPVAFTLPDLPPSPACFTTGTLDPAAGVLWVGVTGGPPCVTQCPAPASILGASALRVALATTPPLTLTAKKGAALTNTTAGVTVLFTGTQVTVTGAAKGPGSASASASAVTSTSPSFFVVQVSNTLLQAGTLSTPTTAPAVLSPTQDCYVVLPSAPTTATVTVGGAVSSPINMTHPRAGGVVGSAYQVVWSAPQLTLAAPTVPVTFINFMNALGPGRGAMKVQVADPGTTASSAHVVATEWDTAALGDILYAVSATSGADAFSFRATELQDLASGIVFAGSTFAVEVYTGADGSTVRMLPGRPVLVRNMLTKSTMWVALTSRPDGGTSCPVGALAPSGGIPPLGTGHAYAALYPCVTLGFGNDGTPTVRATVPLDLGTERVVAPGVVMTASRPNAAGTVTLSVSSRPGAVVPVPVPVPSPSPSPSPSSSSQSPFPSTTNGNADISVDDITSGSGSGSGSLSDGGVAGVAVAVCVVIIGGLIAVWICIQKGLIKVKPMNQPLAGTGVPGTLTPQ